MYLREPARRAVRDVATAAKQFVSQKTGIIKLLAEQPIEQDDPAIFSFGTVMGDTSRYSPRRCSVRNGGAGLTRDSALAATIGEAIERYCSNFYERDQLHFASYDDLKYEGVSPEKFALFSARQHSRKDFVFVPFTSASRICSTWAYSLVDHRCKLVPACFVYLPYVFQQGESLIGPSTSTGLACGTSLEEAILTGIYECIERDAFIIMWLNKLSMPLVDVRNGITRVANLFRQKFATSNIEYYICDITSDIGIPTFYTLAIGQSTEGILACVGSATRLNGEEAIQKTLVECAQGRPYLRQVLRMEPNWSCGDSFSNVRSFDDHGRLYSSMPELIPKLLFVKEGVTCPMSQVRDLSSGSVLEDIHTCVRRLAENGFDVLVTDLTTRDVASKGFRVVRVMVPGLQVLHGDHNFPFLGGTRLYQCPKKLGLAQDDTVETDLYPWPHPFP
jgi:ribosomal protein S12 methylthiotransferase accessory factor